MPTSKIIDTTKVLLVNACAITITTANIQMSLSIVSLVLAICYTVWKWNRDIKNNR